MWILLGLGLAAVVLAKRSEPFVRLAPKDMFRPATQVDIDLLALNNVAANKYKESRNRYIVSFITRKGHVMADSSMVRPSDKVFEFLDTNDVAWALYDTARPDWLNNYIRYKHR